MSLTKPVELSVLISLINGYDILNVTKEQKLHLVSHIHGKQIKTEDATLFETAAEYISTHYPKVAEAAKLVAYNKPDQDRYNKLIDLFKKNHEIAPLAMLQAA